MLLNTKQMEQEHDIGIEISFVRKVFVKMSARLISFTMHSLAVA